ncbi:thiamine pyrophosphate-binding protein [Patescibacteria group bacterium]|nr:thiamine pyrophosphate-binding protein [Patescibacteria group bacterium]
MKLSDYVIDYIAKLGTRHIFVVAGGACIHLLDSIDKNRDVKHICTQHEQAGAMAADAYSRFGPGIGVALATSGPGATNLITGICGAWFDSVPVLYLTGQVNLNETKGKTKVRQIGFQETDIVKVVSSVTKFAKMVDDPNTIKYFLDKAIYEAHSGRPGPVLLDIPLNIQHAEINPKNLRGFTPPKKAKKNNLCLIKDIKKAMALMSKAQRPVVLVGAGVKIAKAEKQFCKLAKSLGYPVVCSWGAIDVVPHDNPLFVGQIGIYGNRGANFLVQNSDLILSIGSRLDTRQTSGNSKSFGRNAKKIIVDIDRNELNKGRVIADVPICADIKDFISNMQKVLPILVKPDISNWLVRAKSWENGYSVCLPEYFKQKKYVNPYVFIKMLSSELTKNDLIALDIGAVMAWTMQAFEIKKGQRLFSQFGHAAMGYALPAAIGVAFATEKNRIICIAGDGGVQMNIQELQTVAYYKLPIKIFVINNNCYGMVRQFQDKYFNSNHVGTVIKKGYSAPNFLKIAKAYGISTENINNHKGMDKKIRRVLNAKGPVLCNIVIKEDQKISPKLEAKQLKDGRYVSKPIEDQWPYLSRKEFKDNMIIPPLDEIS